GEAPPGQPWAEPSPPALRCEPRRSRRSGHPPGQRAQHNYGGSVASGNHPEKAERDELAQAGAGWQADAERTGPVTVPPGARLLELGGGTGEDAVFLAAHERRVLLTDGAPRMVAEAAARAQRAGLTGRIETRTLLLEEVEAFARERRRAEGARFDGAYSNFAALNCVPDLTPIARGLAMLLRPGASAVLVLFGPLPPGEILVQLVHGDVRAAFRRLSRGPVPARL